MLTVGEVIHLNYSKYPNILVIATMKARPNWEKVNGPFTSTSSRRSRTQFAGLERPPRNVIPDAMRDQVNVFTR
jgi:hypothetical protein